MWWILVASAWSAEFVVAPGGDDGGAGTVNDPFGTIGWGIAQLGPGDVLWVRDGTYEEVLQSWPAGASWAAPIRVAAWPGERPVVRPPAGGIRVLHFEGPAQYVEVSGLVLDATRVVYDAVKVTWGSQAGTAHHIRLVDCEVFGAPRQGILTNGDADHNEFIGLDVHDNGTDDFDHGLYLASSHNLVRDCDVHHNAGWGVHVYSALSTIEGTTVVGNRVHDNAAWGGRGPGIGLYSGPDHAALGNMVWNNELGIVANYGASGARVHHNTVVGNGPGAAIQIGDGATAIEVRNNLASDHAIGVQDLGHDTVAADNLVLADPLFEDPAGADFHQRFGSAAIDAVPLLADVPIDIDGDPRPAGLRADAGADEWQPLVRRLTP